MRTSVILSTYNGEKYILQQIESIYKQTIKPDEVIICDDCSSDNTVNIIKKFINDHNLNNWNIYINKENKGYAKNFIDGAKKAKNDILFYSDQDDIWHTKKIEHMCNAIKETNALAIYCLLETIDENGKRINNKIDKMNRIKGEQLLKKVSLSEKLKYARSSGLCLAFKKEILNELTIISEKYNLPHDIPVGTIDAINDRYYVLNEVLVYRRIHMKNVSNPNTKITESFGDIDRQLKSRYIKLKELNAINEIYYNKLNFNNQNLLIEAIKNTKGIISCLENKKILKMLKYLINSNSMMNKKLLIRNFISLINHKIRG